VLAGVGVTGEDFRAFLTVLCVLLLAAALMSCGPKQRCVKEFLFVDYPNGQPDTVYITRCTPVNVP
jgi:hypothetical protein